MKLILLTLLLSACTTDPSYPIEVPGGSVPDARTPVERSCHNGTIVQDSQSETLILRFDCGTYSAGSATSILVDPASGRPASPMSTLYVCGNNILKIQTTAPLIVSEIIGQSFDIHCD